MWAPYDQSTYQAVLEEIQAGDVVLEIGAGDLRLARQVAAKAKRVIAIEIHADLVMNAVEGTDLALPKNLQVIHGDALQWMFPGEITAAVLLMRHCTHFSQYLAKLCRTGCQRLITNARWGMGIEVIDLRRARQKYSLLEIGWYACCCGAVGFKPGAVDALDAALAEHIYEVRSCPRCCNDPFVCGEEFAVKYS